MNKFSRAIFVCICLFIIASTVGFLKHRANAYERGPSGCGICIVWDRKEDAMEVYFYEDSDSDVRRYGCACSYE